jgi:uncharacterized protein (TIGR03067 family)
MRRYAVLALALAVATSLWAAPDKPSKDDKLKKEMKKLEGTWTVVTQERGGSPVKNSKGTFTFAKSKYTIRWDKDKHEKGGKFKVDPTKSPKEMDIVADTPGGEVKLKGIYQIKGDSLKMCIDQKGGERPTKFTTLAGTGQILIVLKRAKAK